MGYLGLQTITGRDFDFLPATGPRVAGIYHWSPELAGEINYLGIHGWNSEIEHTGSISYNGPLAFGVGNTRGGWQYGSRIDSVETNLRWSPGNSWTWIGGFRYVEWSETLQGKMSPPFNVYDYTSHTSNQLYGGQLGLDWSAWDAGGPLRLNLITKAGAFSNRASAARNGESVLVGSTTDSQTSFVGEVAAVARWSLSDTWSLRGGYQLMWLSGIAVAPDQLSVFLNPPDMSGGVLLHGATVGIEAQW